jgi:hypothetical protein
MQVAQQVPGALDFRLVRFPVELFTVLKIKWLAPGTRATGVHIDSLPQRLA